MLPTATRIHRNAHTPHLGQHAFWGLQSFVFLHGCVHAGPFQLLLELFDEETPPDGAATQPACALGEWGCCLQRLRGEQKKMELLLETYAAGYACVCACNSLPTFRSMVTAGSVRRCLRLLRLALLLMLLLLLQAVWAGLLRTTGSSSTMRCLRVGSLLLCLHCCVSFLLSASYGVSFGVSVCSL